ncbi:hypothetical protein KJ780_01210 [Candidatus Micrarchaeota archaeon]|nr:hypothetical protein [Candidatus Micrarchaeota archaeon]
MKGKVQIVADVQEKEAENIISALKKEEVANARVSSKMEIKEGKLLISISAEDMVALRATANSYLRYLQMIGDFEDKIS